MTTATEEHERLEGLPVRVRSLADVLLTLDELRVLLPNRSHRGSKQAVPWSARWIREQMAKYGAEARYVGDQAMWLRSEVERALPLFVRASWVKSPTAKRLATGLGGKRRRKQA